MITSKVSSGAFCLRCTPQKGCVAGSVWLPIILFSHVFGRTGAQWGISCSGYDKEESLRCNSPGASSLSLADETIKLVRVEIEPYDNDDEEVPMKYAVRAKRKPVQPPGPPPGMPAASGQGSKRDAEEVEAKESKEGEGEAEGEKEKAAKRQKTEVEESTALDQTSSSDAVPKSLRSKASMPAPIAKAKFMAPRAKAKANKASGTADVRQRPRHPRPTTQAITEALKRKAVERVERERAVSELTDVKKELLEVTERLAKMEEETEKVTALGQMKVCSEKLWHELSRANEDDAISLVRKHRRQYPDEMELGLRLQPDIVDSWPKKLLEKATELAHKHGGEASTIMKHFIGECLESKFASIDEVFTDKLLAMLPNALQRKECWGNSFEPRVSTRRSSLLVR